MKVRTERAIKNGGMMARNSNLSILRMAKED
jgi:hypothetical protein